MGTRRTASLAVAVCLLVGLLTACGSDESDTARPTGTATLPSRKEPTATPLPTAPPTPPRSLGLNVSPTELIISAAKMLPAGWTLFAWRAPCYQCDGSFADFRRWTSDGNALSSAFLFSFAEDPISASTGAPGVYTVAFAADGRRIAAGLCTHGYCGGLGAPSEDAAADLYRSNDGGLTWSRVGPLARNTYVAGFIGDDVVIRQTTQTGDHWDSMFLAADGRRLDPAGFSADRVVAVAGRDPVWVHYGDTAGGSENHLRSSYQDARGPISVPLPDTDTYLIGLSGTDDYVWELHTAEASGKPTTVLAIADRTGKASRAYRWDGRWWSVRGITGGRFIAGYGDDSSLGEPPTPFIIDLETGTLTPFSGLPRSHADSFTYPFSVAPPR